MVSGSQRPHALLAVLLVFAVLLLSMAARAAPVPPASPAPVLRVGTSGDYAPFSLRDAPGAFTGFDVVVARRFAADVARPVEIVPFRWPELVERLRAGAFDVAMSGVTVRADRALFVSFTRPYASVGAVAVIRAADREKLGRFSRLDRKGVRIAVNRGGHLEQVARRHFPHAQIVLLDDNTALPTRLARGAVDAAISDELEARTWTAAPFITLGPFTLDRKAYALRHGDGQLLGQIDDWLAARETDGWLNQQRRRWLGSGAVRSPREACIEALVGEMDLRLQLMPFVAAVKRREHLPIEDPAQEARVLDRVARVATAAGLEPKAAADLFRVQMEAAKAVEHKALAASVPSGVTLADVRTGVAAVSDHIIAELVRGAPWCSNQQPRDALGTSLRRGLTTPGAEPFAAPLLEAVCRIVARAPHHAAAGASVSATKGEVGPER